jgi:AraC family transcriptional regulator
MAARLRQCLRVDSLNTLKFGKLDRVGLELAPGSVWERPRIRVNGPPWVAHVDNSHSLCTEAKDHFSEGEKLMSKRPLVFSDPGRFEIYCHFSPPAVYPEETHETVQICVPFEHALYNVTRQSETGRALVHHLGARDILAVPVGQPHGVNWRRPADIVSLQMSEAFIAQALGVPSLHLQDTFTLRDPFISAAAAQLRMSLHAEGQPSLVFAEAMATAIAYRVGVGAAMGRGIRAGESVPGLSASQLARIERFIEEHLDQPISLAALAELVDLSMWHFMRRFNASHGLSPREVITQRRLARAQKLLSESKLTITEVALEIGMSHSHFSRSFLRRYGLSPREYRRQLPS